MSRDPIDISAAVVGGIFEFHVAGAKVARLQLCTGNVVVGGGRAHRRWTNRDGALVLTDKKGRSTCIFDRLSFNTSNKTITLEGRQVVPEGADEISARLEQVSLIDRLRNLPGDLAFEGEFGEELNNFIPYVHFLHRHGMLAGRRVITYAGMEPFYFFLDPSQLVTVQKQRRYISRRKAPIYYPNPSGLFARKKSIEWLPDYRTHLKGKATFDKPLLVIHNKFTPEWTGEPINYLPLDLLDYLFERLKRKYQIVFFEAARKADLDRGYSQDTQGFRDYSDVEVAQRHPEVLVFGDYLESSGKSYNSLKLEIFSNCHHFITVQGGNAHMCAAFPGSLVAIQHVLGREEIHAYGAGVFQYLSNPAPLYLIGRNSDAMFDIAGAFEDSVLIGDRVHLGAQGKTLYEKFNPWKWRDQPTGSDRVGPVSP